MQRFVHGLLVASLIAALFCSPARATDRTIWYPQQTVTSTGLNQQERNERLAFGTWLLQSLNLTGGAGTGVYSNLTVSPGTGLYVTTAPTVASTVGAVYQVQQNDPAVPASCPSVLPTCPQVAADSRLIAVPAFQSATSNPIGPLTAPATSGQSVYWLIEAQETPSVDTSTTSSQFVVGQGPNAVYVPQSFAVPIVRSDVLIYQLKEGTPGTSPTEPSVDSGWIGITNCLIPYGTTQVTSGMCTPFAPFAGFAIGNSTVTAVHGTGNITASTASGVVTVTETPNPTWSGTATAPAFDATGTNATSCWLCYGTLGTASAGVLRFSNAAVPSTGYTSFGSANDGTVSGIQNSVLSLGNTGARVLAIDNNGDLGVLGSFASGGTITADGGSAPVHGFACGTGSHACSFFSNATSSSTSAFTFKNSVCSGSNLDVAQFYNATYLSGYVGCDGSYEATDSTGANTALLSAAFGVELFSTLALPIIDANGAIVAAANNTYPGTIHAGELYTSTSGTTGEIQFGLVGAGDAVCSLNFDGTHLAPECPVLGWAAIQADGTAGSYTPTVSSGDLSATRSLNSGALTIGGSTSNDLIDYGVTTTGVETHSASIVGQGKVTATTHNTCTASSGIPCEFTWSLTVSSGTGSNTQSVPATSVCSVTPIATPHISSTNMYGYWVTLVSTTLTIHAQDMLGTATGTITGNGLCL